MGGGPAGLYFAILMKKADSSHRITVYERNRLDDTFGFGVVFSDATQTTLADADPETFAEMAHHAYRWDDIDVHYQGKVIRSTGHGFSGLSRQTLLAILAGRARSLGVELCFEREITDHRAVQGADLVLAADGFNSAVRDALKSHVRPSLDWRPNRFVWLGTTRPFNAFTFYFKWTEHGLWRVHAYQYDGRHSTFIVECTEHTWRASGMDRASETDTVAFCESLFRDELQGHGLMANRSVWRQFATVRNERWHHDNVVLMGDAAHTAHFSIGSGTKLAMEDALALARALQGSRGIATALDEYESQQRPVVESFQRAAQISLEWFENTERYMEFHPLQFGFNLLTRSFRVTHDNLKVRDPAFVETVNTWFADEATRQSGVPVDRPAPPPMFTPFRLRDLVLNNRVVVSPMCQYSADDGMPNDWHLVHLGARAMGGAGLVFAEMTDVSPEARISPGCAGLYRPEHVGGWQRIVDFVHHHTSAKIGIQLGHAGRKGATKLAWEGMDQPLEDGAWPILAPSPLPYYAHGQVPKEMDRRDMDTVNRDFTRSAELAEEAGFDILELHFAHGYLLASFISPLTNRRTDAYGGSLENRMRFPLEILDAARAVWPAHKPLSVRISAVDWAPGGLEAEDAVAVARMLQGHGCDIVDVSAGQTVPDQRPVYGRQFQTPFSDRIRHEAGIATMAVGNISSYTDVNTILAAGRADLCVMARAHLWDPYWTRHAARELGYALPWPPPYESLNRYNPRFV
ncbi:MAG: bifunctional salicylyl-CoA 5-hydroxylase/oxidoreductase [Gemmatimonadetes bacterium]|nr:bifunctional salicylyl-CoA 5-hydroxylase/oxidoreductase [Gemmatimonadota bacterium]